MIDTSSVGSFLNQLLDEDTPGAEILNDLRVDGFYTGNFGDPAFNWGGFGFLPISGFGDGDIAALRPIFGRPVDQWPVMRVSHVGDPGKTFASSIKTFVAAHIAMYGDVESDDLEDKRDALVEFAEFLGDTTGRARAVLDAMIADEFGGDDSDKYEIAEGEGSMLASYYSLQENDEDSTAWQSFTKSFPEFAPGHISLFEILSDSEQPDLPALLPIAWRVFNLDMQCDGSYKAARKAAKVLSENGGDKIYGQSHLWPAVIRMAAKKNCGKAWLLGAQALEKDGNFQEAYNAYKSAAYWIGSEMEENLSINWVGARRCAEQLKDKNVVALFESLEVPEGEDIEKVLADYDREEEEEAEAAAVQKSSEGFFESARTGNVEILKRELDNGAQIDLSEPKSTLTALHFAAQEGHLDAVRLLLERGANINSKNFRSSTPLMLASRAGHLEIVRLLVEKGADLEIVDGRDETALFLAAESGHVEVVKLLVAHGAKLNVRNISKQTPLFQAVFGDHDEVATVLIEAGADVKLKDYSGESALHWAAGREAPELVKLLLRHGANPRAKADDGETPIDRAEAENLDAIVAILKGETPPAETPFSDESMAALARMSKAWDMTLAKVKNVDELNWGYSEQSDEDLATLHVLPKLRCIILMSCSAITDKGMKSLSRCTGLEEVIISNTPVTDAGIAELAGLPSLKKLWIDGTAVTNACTGHIAMIEKLEWLRLNELSQITDSAFAKLKSLKKLQRLDLSGSGISDEACEIIGGFNLESLDISKTQITDSGFEKIKNLKHLTSINFSDTKIGDACFEVLSGFQKLTEIDLDGTMVHGSGIEKLGKLKKLLSLKLGKCPFDVKNSASLKALKTLRVLDLEGSKISDEAVPHLKTMKHLNALIIAKTKISPAGKKILKSALGAQTTFSWNE